MIGDGVGRVWRLPAFPARGPRNARLIAVLSYQCVTVDCRCTESNDTDHRETSSHDVGKFLTP